jgi:hypothetical protein
VIVPATERLDRLLVTLAEAGRRFQVADRELPDSFQGRYLAVDQERLDPIVVEIFGGSPSHSVAENSTAVLECRHNAGMAMRLVMMSMFAFTLSLGVGGECVGPYRAVADVLAVDVKNDEALGSTKMV